MEKAYRSIIKAVSWRLTGTVYTIVISFLIIRKLGFALSIGIIELATKMFLYFLHERIWNKIPLGRIRKEDPEYHI